MYIYDIHHIYPLNNNHLIASLLLVLPCASQHKMYNFCGYGKSGCTFGLIYIYIIYIYIYISYFLLVVYTWLHSS